MQGIHGTEKKKSEGAEKEAFSQTRRTARYREGAGFAN